MRRLLLLAALLALPASAAAHHHTDRYHTAVHLRHEYRRLYHAVALERWRVHHTGTPARLHRLSWRVPRLRRAVAWRRRELAALRHEASWRPHDVRGAITLAASESGWDAAGMIRVAQCESSLNPDATNGQYLGLFQLGDYARARYLRGAWSDALANARAAAAYARDAGGWGPWSCGFAY